MPRDCVPTTAEALIGALERGELDFLRLSIRSQAIAATLGAMLSDGYSLVEIARFYAKSRPWVSARLAELRDELKLHAPAPAPAPG